MAEEKASINVTPPSQYGMSINVSTSENNQIDLVPNKQNIDITTSSPNYMPLNATPDLSMYYSEVSENWAKQAENSAERAAQSATTAKDAADSILNNPEVQEVLNSLDIIEAAPENAQIAQEQATISKTYAEAASTSSTIAQEQATIATTQANLILEQIDDVEQAVKAANTSATNADTSANSAKGYMQSAEASAIAAKASETSAKQSASEALASKNSASASATSASTSATTATTKASEAKTSATQAANSATSASNSATQAQGYAQDALNSKNQAQDIVEQGIEDIQEILENAGGGGSIDESNLVHKDGVETITGAKTFTGAVNFIGSGDGNAVNISTNTRFNVHNTAKTVLGFGSSLFYINHGDYRLRLRGKDTRPHYNSDSNYLALLSDVPDVSNFITMADVENKGYLTSVPSEYVTDTELSTYAYDKTTVDGKIAEAVAGGSVDAYTKSETDALLDKKQNVLSATEPLTIGSKTVGGPYNITTENGYIVPTYKGFPSSRYTIDTSNRLISISNTNATQPITDINSLFSGNCSYFDVPVDFASRISKVQNGEESFASIALQLKGVQTTGNVISFLAGQQTDTEFIPIIFGKASNTTSEGMLIGTALLTSKVIPYSGGVSLEYDTAGTTGTSYSDSTFGIGANFSFNYNPSSNYPLSINTYSYNATTGYYTRVRKSSVTPEQLANLSKINVIRVFWGDTNGGTSVKYFPTVEDTQLKYNYVDTGWRITNGAITTYGVSLKYDNTLKVNDNGELGANLIAGENITIEDNVISAVVPEGGGAGMPVGTIYPLNCSSSYVPEGSLPTDGAEYTKAQFNDLWNNYLTGETYYAYYTDTMYAGGTATLYTASPNPADGDTVYELIDGEMMETSYLVTYVSVEEITFQYAFGVVAGEDYLIGTAYRDTTKDIINSLLNTCSYSEYEADLATYGQCAKFAVDTANETFRVPTSKKLERFLIDKKESTDGDPTWYNVYSDGWCEQGSYLASSATGTVTINLLKDLANTDYSIQLTEAHTSTISDARTVNKANKTTSSFQIFMGSTAIPIYWEACGYTSISSYPIPKEFVVVATGSINQSMMDWSAWASSLQGKANTDGSNMVQSVKNFDGQWVQNIVNIGSQTAKGTYTCDLSSILPSDGYDYEVMFNLRVYNSNSSNSGDVYIYSDIFTKLGTDVYSSQGTCGGSGRQVANTFILPVGVGRVITYEITNYAVSKLGLNIWGYRRIGTNR